MVSFLLPKTYHVDGGAFIEPPDYKFHNAYYTIVSSKGKLIHFEKDFGDFYSGVAEYMAIKWVVENIKKRPLKITSDCKTAISWANKPNTSKNGWWCTPLDLEGIELVWEHGNLADQWNAVHHSPKLSKGEYYERWLRSDKPKRRPEPNTPLFSLEDAKRA